MGFRYTLTSIRVSFRAGDAKKGVLSSRCAPCVLTTHPVTAGAGDCRGQEGRALFLPPLRGVPRSARAPPVPRSSVRERTKVFTPQAWGPGRLGSPCSSSRDIQPAAGAGCPRSPPQLHRAGHKIILSPLRPRSLPEPQGAAELLLWLLNLPVSRGAIWPCP